MVLKLCRAGLQQVLHCVLDPHRVVANRFEGAVLGISNSQGRYLASRRIVNCLCKYRGKKYFYEAKVP